MKTNQCNIDCKINIKPSCGIVKHKITKKNIQEYYLILDERRDIRWGKVDSIMKNLIKKNHFESPIVINETPMGKRVLDGNHRIEAIKKFLENYPDSCVEVHIAKYKGMNRDKEREKYTSWNKGTPESANDYLKNYYKTIPLGEKLLKELPVTLKTNGEELPIRLLVGAEINAGKQNRFEGGYAVGGEKSVLDFQSLQLENLKNMKAFIMDMQDVFGQPHRKSKYYRSTPLNAFYRIWYDNRNIPIPKLKRALKRIYNEWDIQWEDNAKKGGRSACVSFYKDLVTMLKAKNKSLKIKSDIDIIREKSELTEISENNRHYIEA